MAFDFADWPTAIEREAFPAFHDAKVKARTDELAGFLTETLIAVTPVVSEVKAGYRAYRALNDYEAAIEAGDREAAGRHLLEFGTALTEAVPLGGRAGKATRFSPALDKAKVRIGERVAELLGARNKAVKSDTANVSKVAPNQGNAPPALNLDSGDRESFARNSGLSLRHQGNQPTCGSVSVQMILADRGKLVDQQTLADQVGVFRGAVTGALPEGIQRGLKLNGIEHTTHVRRTNIEQLAMHATGHHPAVVAVRVDHGSGPIGHGVIVDGITTRFGQQVVAVRDPATRTEYFIPVERFEKRIQSPYGWAIFTKRVGVEIE